MLYVEVINCTENEMTLRPPWNQGDCHVIPPGGSIPCPDSWLDWASRHGLMTAAGLDKVWEESGLDAALKEETQAASDLEPKEEPDRPLETTGILFDSKPAPTTSKRRK